MTAKKQSNPSPAPAGEGFVNRLVEVVLPGGVTVRATVRPLKQQGPSDGAELVANATLMLRADDLNGPLKLGGKLRLFEADLWPASFTGGWCRKENQIGDWAVRSVPREGDTWEAACTAAENYLMGELEKLRAALQEREDALASEGQEAFLALPLLPPLGEQPVTARLVLYPEEEEWSAP